MKRKDRIHKKYSSQKSIRKASEDLAEKEVHKPKASTSFYHTHYKEILIIPFAILLIAIIFIILNFNSTGEIVNRGISLKGGTSIQIPTTTYSATELNQKLSASFPEKEIVVRELEETGRQIGLTIESNILPSEEAETDALRLEISQLTGISKKDMSIQGIDPTLGEKFFKQTLIAILIAFTFMGLVVFFYFKTFVPSAAVILSAFSDIVVTLAIVNLLNIQIGTAGIAAFLMLIGYSVDTDILLTTRVVKNREGTVYERTINAMKTGLTMTFTTFAAVLVAYIVSDSDVLKEIMLIIIIGLLIDLINTWLQNAGILRYYMEKREQKELTQNE